MSEFIQDIISHDIDTSLVVFLLFFSCFVAIFHSFIFPHLLRIKLRPPWLLFVLYPTLLGIIALINKSYVPLAFITLFLSTFVLAISGMFISRILGSKAAKRERQAFNKKHNIPPKPFWKKLLGGLGGLVFVGLFYIGPAYFIFGIFFVFPILRALSPSSRSRFFKYQQILPTSKVRSVAMGLAELEGYISVKEAPLAAPINGKTCIGYQYTIEKISKDKEGKESYQTIHSRTACNPFLLEDDTGSITVKPERMEMYRLDIDEQYRSASKRYTQRLLRDKDHMLLIGKVSLDNNLPVMEYEPIKKVFGIAPSHFITTYNTYKPLLNRFVSFSSVFGFLVALILLSNIEYKHGKLNISLPTVNTINLPFSNQNKKQVSPDIYPDHPNEESQPEEIPNIDDEVIDTFSTDEVLLAPINEPSSLSETAKSQSK